MKADAVDGADKRRRPAEPVARGGEVLDEVVDFEERGHDTSLSSGARRQREAVAGRRAPRSGGVALRAGVHDKGAARGEAAAGRRPCHVRHACPRWWRDARRGGRAAGSSRAGRPCRDAAGEANSASTGARSTISPAYITATSSQISATTPRSCVIRMMARVARGLQLAHQLEDLRLHGDVERGGRLVGDQQRRIAGQRHRDHHALAHAAGELVRIFVDALLGRGDVHAAQQLDGARRARLRREPPRWRKIVSMIWSPMVKLGLSEVIGSWKIMASRLPRRSRSVCVGRVQEIEAVEADRARHLGRSASAAAP